MKRLLTTAAAMLVLCGAAFAQRPDAPPPPAPGTSGSKEASKAPIPVETENANKARALLDKCIAAMGGKAYLSYVDQKAEGRTYSFYHGEPNSRGILFWRFSKWPDKQRVELTKDRDVVYIWNGDKGWETTFKGTRTMDEKELAEYLRGRHYSLDNILRGWIHEPGVALFYDGVTIAENKQAERVTLMNANNEAVSLDIDAISFLPIRRVFTWREPDTRYRNEDAETYDGYKVVQGIATPHSIVRYNNGEMVSQRFITVVSYNNNLPDTLFTATATYEPFPSKKQ